MNTMATTDFVRPNVLLITCDQMRGMAMSCSGDQNIHTPHLDRLAADGVRWNGMFTTSPLCCPARASMQTGFYPHNAGFNYHNNGHLREDRPTLAEHFAAAGYDTAHIGKWHLCGKRFSPDERYVPPEHHRGFAHWLGYEHGHDDYFRSVHYGHDHTPILPEAGQYEVDFQTDVAMTWVESHLASPWFMDLSFGPPHFPLTVANVKPQNLAAFKPDGLTPRANVPLDQLTAADRMEMAVYYAMIANIDANVGRLLAHLHSLGQLDNTVVVFTSDHGEMLFSHDHVYKRRMYEESIRVPFLIRHPEQIPAGRVAEGLGSLVDLVATLLDLAHLPPAHTEGVSLAPVLRGEVSRSPRSSVPVGCHWLGCRARGGGHTKSPWRGLRTEQFAVTFLQDGPVARPVELFDVHDDPYEMVNLAALPKYQPIVAELWGTLQEHFRATGDDGFIDLELGEVSTVAPSSPGAVS